MSKKLSIWKREKVEPEKTEDLVDETRAIRLDPIPPSGSTPSTPAVGQDNYPYPLPPKKRVRRISRKGSPASRTFSVCVAMSRDEAKFFKGKAKEFNTSLSAMIRTALYVYLQMDPDQRAALKPKQ